MLDTGFWILVTGYWLLATAYIRYLESSIQNPVSVLRPGPEGKMFLAEVADADDDGGGDTLAQERPPAEDFHKHFQDEVVEGKVEHKGQSVPEELNAPPQVGIEEHDVLHQRKTHDKVHDEGDEESSVMRFKRIKPQIHILEFEHVHQQYFEKHKSQYRIGPAAGRVTEGLFGHKAPEGRIEKVDELYDSSFCHFTWSDGLV